MDYLARIAIEKSRLTLLVMIGLLLLGFSSYIQIPKRENPTITVRTSVVTAYHPGMDTEQMEELIAIPIERSMRELGEVEEIDTIVMSGAAILKVVLRDNVPASKVSDTFQEIRNKVDSIKRSLPDDTAGPFVNTEYGNVAIATVAVTGEGFTQAELKAAAESLRDVLSSAEGVSKVSLFGIQEERIWLDLDPRKLAAIGGQLPVVLNDLRRQNVVVPAGEIEAGGTSIALETSGNLDSVSELEGVLTKINNDGEFVQLSDLVRVRRGYVDPKEKPVYFNGEPTIILAVEMSSGRDIQKVGRKIEKIVGEQEKLLPIGVSLRFASFQETNVTRAINDAIVNVLQTFVIVILTMTVCLGVKSALIISSIVPYSIAFALCCAGYVGVELEQVSIAAVIISLGLLVDNGLVVVEDVQRRVNEGMTSRKAAVAASGQFFLPLAVASITTVSAFLPMLMLDGVEGEFAFSLGAVAGLVLVGSFLTAHYILPFLCGIAIKPQHRSKKVLSDLVINFYTRILRKVLPHGLVVSIAVYGVVLLSVGVFPYLKSEMFPLSERTDYLVYLEFPSGTTLETTEEEALEFDKWLRDPKINPETISTVLYVGDGGPRFYLALNPADANRSSAFILVNTESYEGAVAAVNRARHRLVTHHPEIRSRVTQLSMGGAESGIVEVRIKGPDTNALLDIAKNVEIILSEVPGIVLNQNDWGTRSVKFTINIAQNRARELGVASQDVSAALQTYFSGTTVSIYRENESQIPVVLRADSPFRVTIEDLARVTVPARTGLVTLDQIASLQPSIEIPRIRREDLTRQITVKGKSSVLSAAEIKNLIEDKIRHLKMESNYDFFIGGETERSEETNTKLAAGLPAVLGVMLVALVLQFNSFRRVLLTVATIPLIVVGAPIALAATAQPLSFFAILGLISLMGIIVNNAIVLINQIDIEVEQLEITEAIITASRKRFVPILLTSLTTILGLVPLSVAGGVLFEPMATLMIGGLAISTPLSLLLVPTLYSTLMAARS